jgi:hypothetical protein
LLRFKEEKYIKIYNFINLFTCVSPDDFFNILLPRDRSEEFISFFKSGLVSA